jgi:hypothetical protein
VEVHARVREEQNMSASQKELEATPIFAALTAEVDLDQLLGETADQPGQSPQHSE